jgi:small subunit ribosomal protein S18|uniref:Small ribosomal subunit protein bS18c n=1 Tax=Pseudochloris wilhelmii TaxID=1418016 RepID=A0A097KQT4_9CHLO|nr:ribosomal protein S18 [Pseudochloris wilhelmii]AIT95535.1 ribosomal protein S18 [Pseudochloris wilhelmii]
MVGIQNKGPRYTKTKRKPLPVVIIKTGTVGNWTAARPAPRYTIDYKNTKLLVQCISPQGKILSRRASGLTAKQQRVMAKAIKRARMGGLLPFVNLDIVTRVR